MNGKKRYIDGWLISAVLMLLVFLGSGCGSDSGTTPQGDLDETSTLAIVNTRLGDEGSISLIDYATGDVETDLLTVGGACNLTQYGDYVYIVDKELNKISKFDYTSKTVVADMFTGDSTKPYSICIVSDSKGYICLNNETYVGIFNPDTMEMTGQVDISSMAASDEKMQQYHCMVKDGKLFVTLRQNTRNAEKTSSLAVIDIDNDTVVKELVLNVDGVSGMSQGALGGKLPDELTCSGTMYVNVTNYQTDPEDGVIERIDDTDTSDPISTIIYYETDYFGSMAYWVFDSNTTGWAIVGVSFDEADPDNTGYGLIRFDLSDGTFTKVSDFQNRECTYALEYTSDGYVLVGAKDENEYGIWVYDSNNNYEKMFDSPIDVGLLPNRMLIVR